MLKVFNSIVFCVFVLSLGLDVVSAQPQFKGYLENRLYLTFLNNDFNPARYNKQLRWGNYNRARVEMSADVSEWSYVNVTVDYFNYSGYLLQLVRQPGTGEDPVSAAEEQRINLDRAYFKLYFSKADVTVGRQRISWGKSLLWSPFDVFNRVNFLEPQEEKAGITAIRVTVPLGITSSLEGVFSPETTSDESRAGARVIWNMFGTEYSCTAIHNVINTFVQSIYGFTLKTDLILGFWFEGAYHDESPLPGNDFISRDYFRWIAGADYSFDIGRKVYLMAEYNHDESGESDMNRYNYLAARAQGRSLLARDYLYGTVQLTYSDLTSFNTSFMANINDGGVIFMPGVHHSLFPNTQLSLGMYLAIADEGTEFNPTRAVDPFNYAGNSMVYCWIKLFF